MELDEIRSIYERLFLIRAAELKISSRSGIDFKTPIHLSIGQEAVSVSVCSNLLKSDYVFGNHRSHAHFLSLGGELKALFAEILGRVDGCSKGMGGSMHLANDEIGFVGSVPIVAGTIPMAVGAAYKSKRMENSLSLCFFGDGATEEGVFYESLNLASLNELPVIFVCENNLMSSHLHISERQSYKKISGIPKVFGIESIVLNGNDIYSNITFLKKQFEKVRIEKKPLFVEFKTYRYKAHVGPDDDLDIGKDREELIKHFSKTDPIMTIYEYLDRSEVESINKRIENEIDNIWNSMIKSSFPEKEQLYQFLVT